MLEKDCCPNCGEKLLSVYSKGWSDADNTATLRGICNHCHIIWTWKRVFSHFDYGAVGEDFTEE